MSRRVKENRTSSDSSSIVEAVVNGVSPRTLLTLLLVFSFALGFLTGMIYSSTRGGFSLSMEKGFDDSKKTSFSMEKGFDDSKKTSFMIGKYNIGPILKELKVDENKLKKCLDENKYAQKVKDQLNEGAKAGIQGTPGIVIWDRQTNKTVFVPGALPEAQIRDLLSKLRSGEAGENVPKVSPPDPNKDHWNGPKNARFVFIEYSDLECPFCKKVHPSMKNILETEKDVAWVYRHFPLDFHPYAQKLAEASECLAELKGEEAFWKFIDGIFERDDITQQ